MDISVRIIISIVCLALSANAAFAETGTAAYSLSEAISFALKNNPEIRSRGKDREIETLGIDTARAGKMPKLDLNGGVTRYRYASPVTPISGSPLAGTGFPDFDDTINDWGMTLTLPLYRGGRLERAVKIAEIRKSVAEDIFQMDKQELIYNITSIFHKIYQLEKLLEANELSVKQFEAHKKNVEFFLQAGTVPQVELLKTVTELAHARQTTLATANDVESTYELLKKFMGIEDTRLRVSILHAQSPDDHFPDREEAVARALSQRHDYQAVLRKQEIAAERVKLAEGKRLPSVSASGEYAERAGENFNFKDNWNLALRMTVPLFDGGTIKAETNIEKKEMEKRKEEARSLRLSIAREIKDAHLNIRNAQERISVAQAAVETAREIVRIELLKYENGSGTSTDVIDAQTSLLRAETDYHQALYDKNIAIAFLKKAMGEDTYREEVAQ